jgi:hypothetical protein
VFLLLLCNDKAVLGPWVNGRWINLFTGAVIAIMVMLSIILTASVLYPDITGRQILLILIGGSIVSLAAWGASAWLRRAQGAGGAPVDRSLRNTWHMPPLDQLAPPSFGPIRRLWMGVLRAYLLIAAGLVLVRIVQLVGGH